MRRARAPLAPACALLAACALLLSGCGGQTAERLGVEVIAQHRHDDQAFTQGLLWHDGYLYESTGLLGRSSLRQTTLEGEVVRQRDLANDVFGEGLALVGDELLQLTWQNQLLLRYDLETFEPTGETSYEGEGWGLCYDGRALWMSDGSAELTQRDPVSFEVIGAVEVKLDGKPVRRLNELECVGGAVYANVWKTDEVLEIDPTSGTVTALIDASPLRRMAGVVGRSAVLNGIAFEPESQNFLLTGKLWPALFEVRFVKK